MTGTQAGESVRRWRGVNALRWFVLSSVLCLTLLAGRNGPFSRAASAQPSPDLVATEKEICTKNLKLIFDGIEAYQKDHKDLPNWLSDLVPDYLPDANVLVCPVCRRTGQIEKPPLADPNIASSYLFEFCPAELGNGAPANPKATRREWKQRQMSVVGPIVPIVRCRHHK